MTPKPLLILAGPTGAGKTGLALDLARRFGGQIISADAMAVYRYMDIGTAKPTDQERALAPHHLVDVADPDEAFDAARFAREAGEIAQNLLDRDIPVIIAGGTGFYIKALLYGLFDQGVKDQAVRQALQQEAEQLGRQALYERLREKDPAAAAKIHPNDLFRVIRALEVIQVTGKPMSVHQSRHGFSKPRFAARFFCLDRNRQELYNRINLRVDQMMDQGLLEEVQALLDRGYSGDLKSMQSLGYRHMVNVIQGEWTLEEGVELTKRDTRRFAKRQLTWYRALPEVRWFSPADPAPVFQAMKEAWQNPA